MDAMGNAWAGSDFNNGGGSDDDGAPDDAPPGDGPPGDDPPGDGPPGNDPPGDDPAGDDPPGDDPPRDDPPGDDPPAGGPPAVAASDDGYGSLPADPANDPEATAPEAMEAGGQAPVTPVPVLIDLATSPSPTKALLDPAPTDDESDDSVLQALKVAMNEPICAVVEQTADGLDEPETSSKEKPKAQEEQVVAATGLPSAADNQEQALAPAADMAKVSSEATAEASVAESSVDVSTLGVPAAAAPSTPSNHQPALPALPIAACSSNPGKAPVQKGFVVAQTRADKMNRLEVLR